MQVKESPEIEALKSVPLFAELGRSEIQELARSLIKRNFKSGQIIFHLDDPGGLLYIVKQGQVKIYRPDQDGHDAVLAILGKGDYFGEFALFDDSPRSATAKTLTPTMTYTLYRGEFVQFIRRNPDFSLKLLGIMAQHIREMNEQLSDVFFLPLPSRLARQFLRLGKVHGEETEGGLLIPIHLTQTDLAEMTGATRVSINRAIVKFRENGWISESNRVYTIRDAQALSNLIANIK